MNAASFQKAARILFFSIGEINNDDAPDEEDDDVVYLLQNSSRVVT